VELLAIHLALSLPAAVRRTGRIGDPVPALTRKLHVFPEGMTDVIG
jgi:hypothetical protein